jgi:16S rRNA (cytosine967-C5)-methyltransferase
MSRSARSRASVKTASARAVALELLVAVLRRRQPLDQALERHEGLAELSGRDRGFARLLVTTTLRKLGQIDDALSRLVDRPLAAKAAGAKDLLRLGAAQLLFLGTPPPAAVDSTVTLATGAQLAPYRALINAVLRRLAREGAALLADQDAARLNLPAWLWTSWTAAYGEDTVRAIAETLAGEPPLDISVKADGAAWAERLGAEILPTGSLRLIHAGAVTDLPGYDEGAWWVQDVAAALPARLLGEVRGHTVADLCAAPGGKAAQLAAAGASVIAVDRSAARLERVSANLARLRLAATNVASDVQSWKPPQPMRHVLLDAPCSATGTLRRHPDIAWLKSQADIDRMVPVQNRLLAAAIEALAPGGLLVYCVCSLQPEEGPERIAALLASGAPVRRQPIRAEEVGGLDAAITADGDLRTLPRHLAERGGMDGFYAARLVRTA